VLVLEDVRVGNGRGGAGAFTDPFETCVLRSADPRRSGGGAAGSRSFSFMVAAGAVGAR
jgi:hypothetical protein